MNKAEIKKQLKGAGHSQTSIADMLQVSPAAVHYVVSGKKQTPRIRKAIALAIGKPVSEIWPDSSKGKPNA